jgi:hypothetical protein
MVKSLICNKCRKKSLIRADFWGKLRVIMALASACGGRSGARKKSCSARKGQKAERGYAVPVSGRPLKNGVLNGSKAYLGPNRRGPHASRHENAPGWRLEPGDIGSLGREMAAA